MLESLSLVTHSFGVLNGGRVTGEEGQVRGIFVDRSNIVSRVVPR